MTENLSIHKGQTKLYWASAAAGGCENKQQLPFVLLDGGGGGAGGVGSQLPPGQGALLPSWSCHSEGPGSRGQTPAVQSLAKSCWGGEVDSCTNSPHPPGKELPSSLGLPCPSAEGSSLPQLQGSEGAQAFSEPAGLFLNSFWSIDDFQCCVSFRHTAK